MSTDALTIVEEMLGVDPSDRAAALEARCGHDPALRAEVEQLLAIDAEAEGFLDPDVSPLALVRSGVPSRAGPYRLVRLIGEGGFGMVYLAEQTDPIRRNVAVKVIKPGMDSASVIRRFESERQTLAVMEHPNIARVIDGGIIAVGQPGAGRPYFAMEYVEGLPITRFVSQRGATINERLELFLQACSAVQHAHAKGIIHRDLKPSNIIVGVTEGRPVCKIIDFGIAKALHANGPEHTALTQAGAVIGTPQYMSPEQASGSADVDIRSDVYALGAVLYELLSGEPPIEPGVFRTPDPLAFRAVIGGVTPKPPSSRAASRVSSSGSSVRAGEARPDAHRIRRDLDWITLRALEKEPARRYATVDSLADDIRRFLRSEPVAAGPPSITYKITRFVRRNRGGVVAACVVSLAVLAGAVLSIRFGLAAERARIAEQGQRIRAEQNAERVEGINAFLTEDLFLSVNAENLGPDAKVADVLQQAAARIDTRFGDDPAMAARLHLLTASMYDRLFRIDDALRHSNSSVALLAQTNEPLEQLRTDVYSMRATIRLLQGELHLAEADAREASRLVRAEPGVTMIRTMRVDTTLARTLEAASKDEEADRMLSELIEFFFDNAQGVHEQLLVSMITQRLQLLWRTERHEEAAALAGRLIELGKRSDSADARPDRQIRLAGSFWLVQNLRRLGRHAEAAEQAIELVSISQELGGERSQMHASMLMSAGEILSLAGRYAEAVPYLERTLSVTAAVYGDHHYEMERITNRVADAHLAGGNIGAYRDARSRGLLLRFHIAGPGERESVVGIMPEGAKLFDGDMSAWIEVVLAAGDTADSGRPPSARYLSNSAIALHSVGWDGDLIARLMRSFEAIPLAADPADNRAIIASLLPQLLRDAGRTEEADDWSARLSQTIP
jgi:serine/threonine protein kinase/tetratricopeptide (TPR) repeat protein